ncbi:hypothetical protein EVAR_40972_1 [Eumeta japonica]|uniref:Uncharacterized protein n=1 Tax=Eumeta variegata TaxID=151549 RepID=A0A4C1X3W1_EUMVA|nr:hypothetical protein EVAR_40972_1 [Eumeta japonica]
MYQQLYEDAPVPLVTTVAVPEHGDGDDVKRDGEERVILEIGRQDERPKEETTFAHKKYDRTISHHRSFILDDYAETPRIVYYRAQDEDREGRYSYEGEYRSPAHRHDHADTAHSDTSLEYAHSEAHDNGTKLVICDEPSRQDTMVTWRERALQLEKGIY